MGRIRKMYVDTVIKTEPVFSIILKQGVIVEPTQQHSTKIRKSSARTHKYTHT